MAFIDIDRAEIIVPPPARDADGKIVPWPTLGPQIIDFFESHFVYGPGTLKGKPYVVRREFRYLLMRLYEHYPEGTVFDDDGIITDMSGRRAYDRGVVSLPKGSAKCLDPETELILESGARVKAKDLKAGDSVQSYKDGEVVYRRVLAVEEQPEAMTYRVDTDHGRSITVSEGHPFLVSGTQWRPGMPKYHKYTANDPKAGEESWSKVEDLRKGDRLVPALGWKKSLGGDQELGWILGVLAGDASGDGRFSNGDSEITDRLSRSYELTRVESTSENSTDWYIRGIRPLMREHGLYGKNAYEKRVPEAVMSGDREIALGYLAGMLDTDGCTACKPGKGGRTVRVAEWYSVSEDNMRDLQLLLASVGYNADVRVKKSAYKGEPYTSWTVVISNKMDLARLARELPVTRERNVENFKEFRKAIPKGSFGDVNLDKVSSVTPVGLAKTIGVEVEDTHVHVTNGLVTHNTELLALICLAELHPDAPVRFDGYDPEAPGGLAPGRPVASPYIPLLAPTKEQLDDLAFGVASEVALLMDDSDLFDVNKERIMRVGEADSKIVPIANNPGAADGKKPTFQAIDEPHRLTQDRQIQTYTTMGENLPKRYADDPWQLSVTTAGDPSEDSIARRDFLHGMRIYKGEIEQPRMFFYHRGTTDENAKFDTMGQRMRALKEASGEEASKFRDLRSVALKWDEESSDKAYLERVWCNRWIKSAKSAFDVKAFNALGDPSLVIEPGSRVTLGFDGSVNQDSTALVMTEISTGIQNIIGLWERPEGVKEWSVPVGEVDEAVDFCFNNFEVVLMHADPPYWQSYLSKWEGKYGNRVREWPTRTTIKMYYAIRAYEEAIESGALGHNDDERFKRHIASAGKNMLGRFDDEGKEMYRLAKVSEGRKYDVAMAAILSWDARSAALAMGETSTPEAFEPWRIR